MTFVILRRSHRTSVVLPREFRFHMVLPCYSHGTSMERPPREGLGSVLDLSTPSTGFLCCLKQSFARDSALQQTYGSFGAPHPLFLLPPGVALTSHQLPKCKPLRLRLFSCTYVERNRRLRTAAQALLSGPALAVRRCRTLSGCTVVAAHHFSPASVSKEHEVVDLSGLVVAGLFRAPRDAPVEHRFDYSIPQPRHDIGIGTFKHKRTPGWTYVS